MSDTNLPHRDGDTLLSSSSDFVTAMGLTNRPVINGDVGGQFGYAPNIFRYVSEQPHVQQQSFCILLSSPSFFSKLPGGQYLHSLCKSYFENRTKSFEGLSDKIDFNFGTIEFSGRKISTPIGASRTLGLPTHNITDVIGEIYTKFLQIWGIYGIIDPDLGYPRLITLDDPGDMLLDEISCSAIYFEPTHNFRDVSHAALVLGMMPNNTPQIDLRRNKEEDGQLREISTEFTGIVDFNSLAAKEIARTFLKRMPLYNPSGRSAPTGFNTTTSTLASLTNSGTIEQMVQQYKQVTNPNYMG